MVPNGDSSAVKGEELCRASRADFLPSLKTTLLWITEGVRINYFRL